jgi:sugar phosphate isomerase/epimerase
VQLASQLGARCLVVYSGARAGHTHNHARRLLIDALSKLAPLAAEHRVTLALEPMHPDCAMDCTFLTSLDDALEIVRQVDSPEVKLSVDTYHMGVSHTTLQQLHQLAADGRVGVVHLADGHPPDEEQHRTRLGQGCVPLKELVGALREGGYDGDFDVEVFGEEISPNDYESLLRESKDFFERLVAG